MTTTQNNPKTKAAAPFVTVTIQCRPLVKKFLENNFGSPVNIPTDHILYKYVTALLSKPSNLNRRGRLVSKTLIAEVEIGISAYGMKHDGFHVTPPQQRSFNAAIESYIKVMCRNILDAALMNQDKVISWKTKYFELLKLLNEEHALKKERSRLRKELKEHQVDIKTAIDAAVYDFLKLDVDVLPYDTVKKDYYRYRMRKKFGVPLSSDI